MVSGIGCTNFRASKGTKSPVAVLWSPLAKRPILKVIDLFAQCETYKTRGTLLNSPTIHCVWLDGGGKYLGSSLCALVYCDKTTTTGRKSPVRPKTTLSSFGFCRAWLVKVIKRTRLRWMIKWRRRCPSRTCFSNLVPILPIICDTYPGTYRPKERGRIWGMHSLHIWFFVFFFLHNNDRSYVCVTGIPFIFA